jgi:hypothetical protein
MEQCAEHANVCKDLGGISANITNLTAAVVALTAQIEILKNPIYEKINFVEGKLDKHEDESYKYREKIILTEKVLQDYMKHQDEKEKTSMWRIGITVTIISVVVQVLMRVLVT